LIPIKKGRKRVQLQTILKKSAGGAASSRQAGRTGAARNRSAADPRLFSTPEAEIIKQEICEVGRKLWLRQYVDGNGGNISSRIGPNEVICTPTLISKYDMTPEDLCLVDLEGKQAAGTKRRTSEIRLHLEIYKEVAEARGVVHCHPPHATAYAITGRVPPSLVIPEFEVFVGRVAISPYETPGTTKFARTVLPFVRDHNTVILTNHGIVSWGDTITHAEWYAEVLETYCWTLMLAGQLGAPISHFTERQCTDLLAMKKPHGLPDPRFDELKREECRIFDREAPNSIALPPPRRAGHRSRPAQPDRETLVKSITEAVMSALEAKVSAAVRDTIGRSIHDPAAGKKLKTRR
jgi:L-fuculose-phosphate aldolase